MDMIKEIKDLDLGRFSENIDKSKIILNSDGTYDYDGNLVFEKMNLKSLKEIPIKFRKVNGSFDCSNNDITSLQGVPLEVGGHFWCYNNNLLSKAHLSMVDGDEIDFRINPFKITDNVIETVKQMTHEQQMAELDFFKENDQKAFEMMKEILDGLGLGYGEETRKMADSVKVLDLKHLGI
jgi:hypothetical protein